MLVDVKGQLPSFYSLPVSATRMHALQLQQKKHCKDTSFCSLLSLTDAEGISEQWEGGEKRAKVTVHVAFTAQRNL